MNGASRQGVTGRLLANAAWRLRGRRAGWADAMLAEAAFCESGSDRLGWAWGCWVASLRACFGVSEAIYCAALTAGLALLTGYEWGADEGSMTVVILGSIALALGLLRPSQALVSGALVGVVVAGVIGFEALSGIRPAYEAREQTLGHSFHWLILLAPALLSAFLGAWIGCRVRLLRPQQ